MGRRRKTATAADDTDDIRALIKAADCPNPKPGTLKRLRARLDVDDSWVKVNETASRMFSDYVDIHAPSKVMQEMINREVKKNRTEMGYDSACPSVRMLINNVILCQLRFAHYSSWLEQRRVSTEGYSIKQGLYWDQQLSNHQKRLMKAIESLAKVRRVIAETELIEQRARAKRSQSTLTSVNLMKKLSS